MKKHSVLIFNGNDVETIEALHDLLTDNHGYTREHKTLVNARSLLRKMYDSLYPEKSRSTIDVKAIIFEATVAVVREYYASYVPTKTLTSSSPEEYKPDFQVEDIMKKLRFRPYVVCRQIICYLLRKHTHWSNKAIGIEMGGYDHSTVIHSCRTVEGLMDVDIEFNEMVKKVEERVDFYINQQIVS